jgi:hypothetical protein
MTSTSTPVSASMRSTSSLPLAAVADRARRLGDDFRRAERVGELHSGGRARSRGRRVRAEIRPLRATSSPRRSISFSRATASKVPSACTSATSRWNEFEPRSSARCAFVEDATSPVPDAWTPHVTIGVACDGHQENMSLTFELAMLIDGKLVEATGGGPTTTSTPRPRR